MFDKKMFGYVHCSRNLNMFVHLLRKNIENKTNMTRDFTWNLSNICPDKNLHFKKIFSKFRENI